MNAGDLGIRVRVFVCVVPISGLGHGILAHLPI
jgi:hypothetical protein